MVTEILRADLKSIPKVAGVFDLYRQHYGEDPDIETCITFLEGRIHAEESIIFFAQNGSGEAIGFAQAYPIFCSVPFRRDLFLGDLFVLESERGKGVGWKLLDAVKEHGIKINSKGTLLTIGVDNVEAQRLYIHKVAESFDLYRQFYGQKSDIAACAAYLGAGLKSFGLEKLFSCCINSVRP